MSLNFYCTKHDIKYRSQNDMPSCPMCRRDQGDPIVSGVVAAVTDSAILGTLVGGSVAGAIIGDLLDGDLFD